MHSKAAPISLVLILRSAAASAGGNARSSLLQDSAARLHDCETRSALSFLKNNNGQIRSHETSCGTKSGFF